MVADDEDVRVGPEAVGAGDQDAVGGAVVADDAFGVSDLAAVGDGQPVERARHADGELAAVAPERAGASHNGVVAGGEGGVADDAVAGDGKDAAIGDDLRVERPVGADHPGAGVVDGGGVNDVGGAGLGAGAQRPPRRQQHGDHPAASPSRQSSLHLSAPRVTSLRSVTGRWGAQPV